MRGAGDICICAMSTDIAECLVEDVTDENLEACAQLSEENGCYGELILLGYVYENGVWRIWTIYFIISFLKS